MSMLIRAGNRERDKKIDYTISPSAYVRSRLFIKNYGIQF